MKTASFVLALVITFVMQLVTVFAQDSIKRRIDVATEFVNDLRRDVPNDEIFKRYLRSGGAFKTGNVKQTANEWTDLLRNSVRSTISEEVEIYKYSTHPEKGRKLKPIEDPGNELEEHVPLEFELHSTDNSVLDVDMNDLYVLKMRDERVFVLFDGTNKMITYFALKWGQKVELTEL